VKLCLLTKEVKAFIASEAERNEKREPIRRRVYWWAVKENPVFRRSNPLAAIIVGMARRKESSTASTRVSPENRPPTIEAAERETPGIRDKDWKIPMERRL